MPIDTNDSATVPSEINKYDFRNEENYVFKARKGIDADIVNQISEMKGEPKWMRDFRLNSLKLFESRPTPKWGGNIDINFQDIYYYMKPTEGEGRTWDDVPEDIKNTFDKLGIPEAEKKYLAGVKAQYESEVVYGSLQENLKEQGVVFLGTDDALKQYPDLFKEYFATVIPATDNKLAALNSAVWSGGSFVYVPDGIANASDGFVYAVDDGLVAVEASVSIEILGVPFAQITTDPVDRVVGPRPRAEDGRKKEVLSSPAPGPARPARPRVTRESSSACPGPREGRRGGSRGSVGSARHRGR